MTSANTTNMIELRQVSRRFGQDVGVFDLNFDVPGGTIFGLIGPSGCGKTTTMRLMLGLYKADEGQISVLGERPSSFRKSTRERIGYMPQHFVLYPNLTVHENLRFVASLYGMPYGSRRARLDEMLEFVELSEARNRLSGRLSGGMQRRLELACSLVHNPVLLFADEPTAGIDPVLRGKFWEYFRGLRDLGHTLFVTTQYVGEAAYCDRVGVMREGRLLYIETPDNLRRRALGGEVIKLQVDPGQIFKVGQLVQQHPLVRRVRVARNQPGLLYITVNEFSTDLAPLLDRLHDHPEIKIQAAEEYLPPFDDIFITLMEQAESQHVV